MFLRNSATAGRISAAAARLEPLKSSRSHEQPLRSCRGNQNSKPSAAARSPAHSRQLGRHRPRPPPPHTAQHPEPHAAGRHPGAPASFRQAGHACRRRSPPPPSRPTTAERRRIGPRPDSPTFVSNSRSRRRRAEARRGPGDFTPASAPAPLTDTARRQRSGVELGKLSAEAGNNKRGARPQPPPPPTPRPGAPRERGSPRRGGRAGAARAAGPERRAPPGGRPAPPAAAARGVPAWREAHPGPLRGRGAGDRRVEGGKPAPSPAERRTETPRSAGNGGGRRTHRPGLSRCLLRPQNHNKALPKMAARPCPAGGRRGRGLRAREAGPGGGRATPTWLRQRPRGAHPHPRRPPLRAGIRVRARPPPRQSAPSSRSLGRRGELLRVPESPAPRGSLGVVFRYGVSRPSACASLRKYRAGPG